MKKVFTLLTALVVCSLAAINAAPPLKYYEALQGKTDPKEILQTLAQISNSHFALPNGVTSQSKQYDNLKDHFLQTDVYPSWHENAGYIWDMYSNQLEQSWDGNKFNREHSFPKSWWGGDETVNAYCDLFHLYCGDKEANNAKRDYPMGYVATATFDNGVSKVGAPKEGFGGGADYVFEPADAYKGDFARSYMYVATTYNELTWAEGKQYMVSNAEALEFTEWAAKMLLDWDRHDPISEKELYRIEQVQQIQGNRNPFIDLPGLADYIWGEKVGEALNLQVPHLAAPSHNDVVDFGSLNPADSKEIRVPFLGAYHTDDIAVSIDGVDSDKFIIEKETIAADDVNGEEGTYLVVKYDPTSVEGTHAAQLNITFAQSYLNNASPLLAGPGWEWVENVEPSFAALRLAASSEPIDDTLTAADFGAGTTSYGDCTATGTSGASYSANMMKDSSGNIQLRSSKSNSGIVVTTAPEGKLIASITIPATASSYKVNIYAGDEVVTLAYMYETGATVVGTITTEANEDVTYTFETPVAFAGIRSKSGAIYLPSVVFTWVDATSGDDNGEGEGNGEGNGEGDGESGDTPDPETPENPDPDPETSTTKIVTDILTYSSFTLNSNSESGYRDFSAKNNTSGAEYAGYMNYASNQDNIQLRSNYNNSGLVVDKAPANGKVKSVTVTLTAADKQVDFYANDKTFDINKMYASTDGALKSVGNIKSTAAETPVKYTFDPATPYFGMRSHSGTIYITKIEVEWEVPAASNPEPDPQPVQTVAPEFSLADGAKIYATGANLTITAEEGATVKYTVGTDAEVEAPAPVTVTLPAGEAGQTITVKATAIAEGKTVSDEVTATYTYVTPFEPVEYAPATKIEAGKQYIFAGVVDNSSTYHLMTGLSSNKKFLDTTTSKDIFTVDSESGHITVIAAGVGTVEFEEAEDGKYYIKVNGQYFQPKFSDNQVTLVDSKDAAVAGTVSVDGGKLTAEFVKGDTKWFLRFNPGTPRFTFYKQGQNDVLLYEVYDPTAAPDPDPEPDPEPKGQWREKAATHGQTIVVRLIGKADATVPSGVKDVVAEGEELVNVNIYDLNGRLVCKAERVASISDVKLQGGMYIVTADNIKGAKKLLK